MEYMKLDGFLGGAVSKLINKGIESKFGYKPNVSLDRFSLTTTDSTTKPEGDLVVNMQLTMSQEDFNKLIEEATK